MARSKPKRHTPTKKHDKVKMSPAIRREVLALLLIAASVLLVIAFFGTGGFLPEVLNNSLRLFIGRATYLLPVLLLFLVWRLYKQPEDQSVFSYYIGLMLVLFSISGLLHIGVDTGAGLDVARDGNGGGLLGYLAQVVSLSLLNVFAASFVLVTLGLVGIVLAFNIQISHVLQVIASSLRKEAQDDFANRAEAEPIKASKMTINAKVPLVSDNSIAEPGTLKEDHEVLITGTDPDWQLPGLDLLEDKRGEADAGNPKENAEIIQSTLSSFGIEVAMEEVNIGPTVTQYTLRPASGVRLSKISELANNLELSLAAHPIRIEAPIPGKSAVGIEIPNRKTATVRLKEVLEAEEWQKRKGSLNFALGRDIAGQATVADLHGMPHLLIAGATGSGKSIMINGLLMSLLYRNSPANLKLILVDPKRVELSLYSDIPHLLAPVIVEPEKCISALKWAIAEMERRYTVFSELGKRNIAEYNALKKEEAMPYIVIIIDELADLMSMAAQDVEGLIVRLAQKARATGIHLVLATQRPSVNVITGLIKANIPARIAFSTVSQVDSRTIIDQAGAEKLLGKGDMLYLSSDFIKSRRIQGVFISEKEVRKVTDFLRFARAPEYNNEVLTQSVKLSGKRSIGNMDSVDDELFTEAAQLVIDSGKASASLLQRRLRIGYARAARLLDMLEEQGVVSGADGARSREVLATGLNDASEHIDGPY
jgi:S-DNA-T family DNA segregation ATPase FtsK/SpoIIIE